MKNLGVILLLLLCGIDLAPAQTPVPQPPQPSQWHIYCDLPHQFVCSPTINVGGLNQGDRTSLAFGKVEANFANMLDGTLPFSSININGYPAVTYPTTAAETANSVTPVSYTYPPGNVLRYMTAAQIADSQSGTCPNSLDDTGAVQAALNLQPASKSSRSSVYFPAGCYLVSSASINTGYLYDISGAGRASRIYCTGSSTACLVSNMPSCCIIARGRIHDLAIFGNTATTDLLDLIGISNIWIDHLYLQDVPAGKDGIFINGSNSVHMHEAHLRDIECYQAAAVAGNACIEFGGMASDSEVSGLITEEGDEIVYGIELDSNASSILVQDSHISDAATNAVLLAGSNQRVRVIGSFLDTTTSGDVLSIGSGSSAVSIIGTRIFNIPSGHSGISIASSTNVAGTNLEFVASTGGAGATVTETGTSDKNTFSQLFVSGTYSNPAVLTGLNSSWRVNGADLAFSGVAQSLAAGSTVYIGNGASATSSMSLVQVPAPLDGVIRQILIEASAAPGGTDTFTATVYDGSSATPCVATITGSAFAAQTGCFVPIAAKDSLSVQLISSATATTSNVRVTVVVNQ